MANGAQRFPLLRFSGERVRVRGASDFENRCSCCTLHPSPQPSPLRGEREVPPMLRGGGVKIGAHLEMFPQGHFCVSEFGGFKPRRSKSSQGREWRSAVIRPCTRAPSLRMVASRVIVGFWK